MIDDEYVGSEQQEAHYNAENLSREGTSKVSNFHYRLNIRL